jgi:hypothetical protein
MGLGTRFLEDSGTRVSIGKALPLVLPDARQGPAWPPATETVIIFIEQPYQYLDGPPGEPVSCLGI